MNILNMYTYLVAQRQIQCSITCNILTGSAQMQVNIDEAALIAFAGMSTWSAQTIINYLAAQNPAISVSLATS
jgi:hypothetical protein